MSKYLFQVNYVGDGVKGLVKEGGSSRRAAAETIVLTASATGSLTVKTTVLITPEEVDEAVKKHPSYRPPGQ